MGTLQVGGTTLGVKNTVTNKVDLSNVGDVTLTSSANIKGAINASGDAPIYACRAWVNFDGTSGSGVGYSNITIRGSGNVSSITDKGTGDYTVNFTTAMPDANYALAGNAGTGSPNETQYVLEIENSGLTTTEANINTGVASGGSTTGDDAGIVTVMFIR